MDISILLVAVFLASALVSFAMLRASGAMGEFFGRVRPEADAAVDALVEGSPEWIANHEFWELGEVEEVAF